MNQAQNSRNQTGFSLIELMLVVVILSVLAGVLTMSVSSTESRKNRAFYEHLIDSLSYVRLVSAERMQPMGLIMQSDKQGQSTPAIVALTNPYAAFEAGATSATTNTKNSMELSAMSANDAQMPTPQWVPQPDIELPEPPSGVSIEVIPLESRAQSVNAFTFNPSTSNPKLQPWFIGSQVPQALWFGTGEAAPARIEVKYQDRLVGDAIVLMPDGRIQVGE